MEEAYVDRFASNRFIGSYRIVGSKETGYRFIDEDGNEFNKFRDIFLYHMLGEIASGVLEGLVMVMEATGVLIALESIFNPETKPNQLEISVEGKTAKIQACPCHPGMVRSFVR